MPSDEAVCEWLSLEQALTAFVHNVSGHQGQGHIRPLHYYVACRLVIEGGFLPTDIIPRPPFLTEQRGSRRLLVYSTEAATGGEQTVLGGLKTKAIDVVVTKAGIGPVLAVSLKGTLGAFRNLTNRMEEAVGDCTNLHLAYPALVYGFLHVLRATRSGSGVEPNDVCIGQSGEPTESITRYHEVLARLDGRRDLRDDPTKYEAVALGLVQPDGGSAGGLFESFPHNESRLHFGSFFRRLYEAYDLRFVYAAPRLEPITSRLTWDLQSPAMSDPRARGYEPRVR